MSKTTPAEQANPIGKLTKFVGPFKVPWVDMGAIIESRGNAASFVRGALARIFPSIGGFEAGELDESFAAQGPAVLKELDLNENVFQRADGTQSLLCTMRVGVDEAQRIALNIEGD